MCRKIIPCEINKPQISAIRLITVMSRFMYVLNKSVVHCKLGNYKSLLHLIYCMIYHFKLPNKNPADTISSSVLNFLINYVMYICCMCAVILRKRLDNPQQQIQILIWKFSFCFCHILSSKQVLKYCWFCGEIKIFLHNF